MIVVNEEERPHRPGLTVLELLIELDPRLPLVAVKMDGRHLPRAQWKDRVIEDGDEITILPVFAGG